MWSIHDGRVTTSSVSFYRLGSVTPKGNPTPTTVTPRAPPRAPGTRQFARGLCGWSVWTFEVGGRPPRGLPHPSVLPRPPRASSRCSVCQCLMPPYGDVFSRCLPRGRHWHRDCHGTAGFCPGVIARGTRPTSESRSIAWAVGECCGESRGLGAQGTPRPCSGTLA